MKEMKVVISGGTGLIGKRLTRHLLAQNHQVIILSRNKGGNSAAPVAGMTYSKWSPSDGEVDQKVIENADAIVNLAGDSINQRWTKSNKESILNSRLDSTHTLVEAVKKAEKKPGIFISASAIGYYPDSDELKTEEDPPGENFLSSTCVAWENATKGLDDLEIRKVIVRIGVVLAREGGALDAIKKPVKFGAGAPLGSGKQYQSFIHLDDLSQLIIHALTSEKVNGVYNAVAPHATTNNEMTELIAQMMNRPYFLPRVPAFFLKLVLGEMAAVVLTSNKISSKKITTTGFSFTYPDIRSALDHLLHPAKNRRKGNFKNEKQTA
ncbi:TIGR01777 family oxidoreductase [Halocola ammonii]